MALDVQTAAETLGTGRFHRWAGTLVGSAALVAAALAVLQVDATLTEQQALHRASRVTVRTFEGGAASSARFSFVVNSLQDAIALSAGATARLIASIQLGDPTGVQQAVAEPDVAVGERLFAIAERMGALPDPSTGVDQRTSDAVAMTLEGQVALVAEQNRLVDAAAAAGARGTGTLLALSVLALAAVLVGLGATFGPGPAGRLALGAATVGLIASVALGVATLVL